jgi:hypothetical protein
MLPETPATAQVLYPRNTKFSKNSGTLPKTTPSAVKQGGYIN